MKHEIHDDALREFGEAIDHYRGISPALGAEFYREIERLILEVCAFPTAFRQFDPPARRHFSTRFPFGIIYLAEKERVWIVAIMPLRRDPSYWKQRLPSP